MIEERYMGWLCATKQGGVVVTVLAKSRRTDMIEDDNDLLSERTEEEGEFSVGRKGRNGAAHSRACFV